LVRVVAEPELTAAPATPIEVVLAAGRVLRVGAGFDGEVLRAVVDALEVTR
jgi:hypothetical protein